MYTFIYTSSTALIQPSFSGLFVTWAYLPQTTLPPCVTRPSSEMFTSRTVPFVITPKLVNIGEEGFFLTPMIGKQKVAWKRCFFERRVFYYWFWYLELWMCDMRFLESHRHRANESFIFWVLSGEILRNEADFGDHSFPRFLLSFTRCHHFEDFGFGLRSNWKKELKECRDYS